MLSALKMRFMTKFPARVTAATGLLVERTGRVYNFLMDWLAVATVDTVADPTSRSVLVVSGTDSSDQLYERISLSGLQASINGVVQEVLLSGATDVSTTAGAVRVEPAVAGAVSLQMPVASAKIGAVTIADWKQNAGTNNITVLRNGTETFNGLAQDWLLAADGAVATFIPVPGKGYIVR